MNTLTRQATVVPTRPPGATSRRPRAGKVFRAKKGTMSRLDAKVDVRNPLDESKQFSFVGMVDPGASYITLPSAWRDRLAPFALSESIRVEIADGSYIDGEVCGPVTFQIEGLRAASGEVLFIDMESVDGEYEPLIGHIALELSRAAVDLLDGRLIDVMHVNLK